MGSATGRAGNRAPLQRKAFGKGLRMVLAEDRSRDYGKASVACDRCDSCGAVVDLDFRVKPRDSEALVRVALRDVRCPRCDGHGRQRIIALSHHPSI